MAERKLSAKQRVLRVVKNASRPVLYHVLFPRVYAKAAKAPVQRNKVLFVENKACALSDNYRQIVAWLRRDGGWNVQPVLLAEGRVSWLQYLRNCLAFLREAATAGYVFFNDASKLYSCVKARPETCGVQVWHACGAFKKWGMSTADLLFGGSAEEKRAYPFYEHLNLVSVSSPEVAWAYVEAMDLKGREDIVRALGVSRTDVFFQQDYLRAAREAVQAAVPAASGKKVALYAPTFRGRTSEAEGPNAFDLPAMKAALGGEWVLLVKHHPFVKDRPAIPESCRDFAFDVSDALEIDQLLCRADACISDYSSLVFEYSLFERPMLFFAFDKADYDDWRGFYYDYNELAPGPVFETTGQVVDYLLHVDDRFDVEEVRRFRRRFMSACDGHATERLCAEVFGG